MAFDNTNRISLFRNEKKRDDRDPDFTGSLNVDGVEFFVDVWKRKPDANPKAPPLSGRVKRKQQRAPSDEITNIYGGPAGPLKPLPRELPPLDDDIPF